MTLQLVIKAGEWSRVAERWFCLLLHGNTMLLLSPSGSGWAAPGKAEPCHLPPLLFIRGTLALLTQAKTLHTLITRLPRTVVSNK